MNKPVLWVCLVLCFCFVLAAFFSEHFAAVHEVHNCQGEGCPVCLLIQAAKNFSRQFKYAALFPGVLFGAASADAPAPYRAVFPFAPLSSVGLKVKMNR
ncbi:MAG: hypothetical protein LBL44_06120 [Treponema sp.]|jgi:hypothetical protein|nr:hypothetical protein [Treponema sp.]